jgi:hypothetical protein
VEGTLDIGIIVLLEEILSLIESRHHARGLDSLRWLFERSGRVLGCSTKKTSSIIILRIVGSRRVANFPRGGISGIITVGTSDGDESTQ